MTGRNQNFTLWNPYESLYTEFGFDSRSLGWSKAGQNARFNRILDLHNFKEAKLLDIGSGFSDFLFFLLENGINLKVYTGIENYFPFFQIGFNRINSLHNYNYKVLNSSWENLSSDSKFEITIAIGTFNFKVDDNYNLILNFIEDIINKTNDILIISLLSAKAPKAIREVSKDKFFYDPNHLSKLLLGRGFSFQIIDDYLPHDFMLKIRK